MREITYDYTEPIKAYMQMKIVLHVKRKLDGLS